MPSQNETLITLLRDVHQSCLTKLQTLQSAATGDTSSFSEAQAKITQLESDFNNEALWAHTLDYDNHELLQAIVAVKMAPDDDPDGFLEKTAHLIAYLRADILDKLQAFSRNADTSVWNQKMLDELLKMRRALRKTKNDLIGAGHDLENDSEFVDLENNFTALLADYRTYLRDNKVQSNEDDIRLIQLLIELVKSAATVKDFKAAYQTLNDFVKSQIPDTEKEES